MLTRLTICADPQYERSSTPASWRARPEPRCRLSASWRHRIRIHHRGVVATADQPGLTAGGTSWRRVISAYPSRYDALRDPSLGDAEECCSEDAETVCPR